MARARSAKAALRTRYRPLSSGPATCTANPFVFICLAMRSAKSRRAKLPTCTVQPAGAAACAGVAAGGVTAAGLGLAWIGRLLLAGVPSPREVSIFTLLCAAAVAAALASGAAGTLRLVGRGPNLAWFAAGLGGGVVVATWLR